MLQRTAFLGVVITALVTAAAPAQAALTPTPAPAASPKTQAAAKAGPPKTITLLTGDKITLRTLPDKQEQLSVKPGPGREKITFTRRRSQDGLSVVPMDAMPLLAAGRLDPRLFNVTRLAEFGYDDAASQALPLIVTYAGDTAALRVAGGRPLPAINGMAQSEPHAAAGALWKSLTAQARTAAAPEKIWLDGKAKVSLDVSVPHIGAPQAWAAGHTGKDVTVAVLDTGYDPGHADLSGLVAGTENFTAEPDVRDLHGHGTHVASTIAGSGAASGGRYKGVAPDAKLLIGKVCDQTGNCPDSGIIEGMTWAAEKGARVVNLSLGEPDAPGLDPAEQAVNALSEKYGTLFVIAAGNDGPQTLGSPSSADRALSVGASFRDDDTVAQFSSTGPRPGDAAVKPDLIAPGVGIVAARAADTYTGAPVDNESYAEMSGTSMATPHVTGAAAIVAGMHPDWKADQIKAALMASTAPGDELGAYVQGSGRVDVARAVDQRITTEPASLSMGLIELPHAGPVRRTLTYRNDGDADVRLDLAVTAKDGHGKAVTPFELGATTVNVPAHGTAQVQVTAVPGATGMFSGTVIATGAGASVRTGIGMQVEPEKRGLKLTFTGSDGEPAGIALAGVIDIDAKEQRNYDVSTGALDLRLEKGHRYTVVTLMADQDGAVVMAADPEFTLDGDRTFASDARRSKPVDVRTDEPTARLAIGMLGMLQLVDGLQPFGVDVDLGGLWGADHVEGVKAIPTTRTASKKFAYYRWTQWARPKGDGSYDDSPYYYHLMKAEPRIPADPGYRPRRRELAEVTSTYAAQRDGKFGEHFALPAVYGTTLAWMPYGEVSRFPLPFRRTEYYTPGDTGWYPSFVQYKPADDGWDNLDQFFFGRTTVYRAGQKTTDRWNTGVFGASLNPDGDYSWREGDLLQVSAALFEDGVPERHSYGSYIAPRAKLYRDGKEIFASDYLPGNVELPADGKKADYRLTMTADRDPAMTKVSTRVSAEWRFRSKTPKAGERDLLPLLAVKVNPELDERNRAAVGHTRIPLQLQRQAGSADLKVSTLTVEVSYDDGRTWLPTLVHPSGKGAWSAETWTPSGARGGFASLRVKATDTGGNAFSETVVRAYEIK
ncbi:S8 family serine peptidase [Sphaerisporangium sp. NPDC004334]